jgi:hypothetical protein
MSRRPGAPLDGGMFHERKRNARRPLPMPSCGSAFAPPQLITQLDIVFDLKKIYYVRLGQCRRDGAVFSAPR